MTNDLDKLLGGYATGTLTEEERKALFEAALGNQQLFNALADEEVLKELLDEPESRKRLLALLENSSSTQNQGRLKLLLEWFRRPFNLTLTGSIAAAAAAVFIFVNLLSDTPRQLVDAPLVEAPEFDPIGPVRQRGGKSDQPELESRPSKPLRVDLPPPPPSAIQASPPEASPTPGSSKEIAFGRNPATDSQLTAADQTVTRDYTLSVGSPTRAGSAQRLFYARLEVRHQSAAASLNERQPSATEQTRRDRTAERKSLAPPPSLSTSSAGRIGLKLTLQIEEIGGIFSAIKLDQPFREEQKPRLTVTTNTSGYLYVIQAQNGDLRVLFPPSHDSDAGAATAPVWQGQTIGVPLPVSTDFSGDLRENRFVVVLTRREIPDLAASSTTAAAIQERLNTFRSVSGRESVIVEEDAAAKTTFFVSGTPLGTTPLVIELNMSRP